MQRLAFVAWMSVLGLLTMIAIAVGMDVPLLYSDEELLDTIVSVFEPAKASIPGNSFAAPGPGNAGGPLAGPSEN